MLWLNPLFLLGNRGKLLEKDMYPIGELLSPSKLTEAVGTAWDNSSSKNKRRLALSLLRTFSQRLILIQLPRLALVGFSISQPFLVKAAISFITNQAARPVQHGYGLVGAFALVYSGVGVISDVPHSRI
jgi:ATP-binding cassette subfamily C (CFTR/MRP) protein 1